jgi:hypothetical protein
VLTAILVASGQRADWFVGFLLQIVRGLAWEEVWDDSKIFLKWKIITRLEKLVFVSLQRNSYMYKLEIFFFFFAVLKFELRTSPLVDRYSTTWVTPLALFVCVFVGYFLR